jgi:DNA replication and repair protein RecF
VLVTAVEANPSRSLVDARIELGSGVASLIGPNGAGKTNLLEALYFALTGRSFRTSDRRDLIPFGGQLARAEAVVRDDDGIEHRLLASVSRAEGRRHLLDGSPVDAATAARHRPPVAVFSPDRLALIKGPPAERRAHVDRFVAARWPSRAGLRVRFGQALAQRNALLSRAPAGGGELEAWDASFAEAAAALVEARAEALEDLAPRFASSAAELGLEGAATLEFAPRAAGSAEEIREGLAERREADVRLGRSSWGPHLDEVKIAAGERALRRFGSQGQQRTALLALLFAERSALAEARRVTPLLLLDDVMSELDPERRERLVELLAGPGQVVITAATEESVPAPLRVAATRMPLAQPVTDAAEAA